MDYLGQERATKTTSESPDSQPETATLQDLSQDFHLFTPALVVCRGGLDRDPVAFYTERRGLSGEDRPSAIDFERPLFAGLGYSVLPGNVSVNWDHRLYAIQQEMWDDCVEFIGSMGVFDRMRKHYARFPWNDIEIVDVLAMQKRGGILEEIPMVRITAFGVASNRVFLHLAPSPDPPTVLPTVARKPPRDAEVQEARTLLESS